MHGRTLQRGSKEAHDRKIREGDLVVAASRAMYDHEHAFDVIRRGAAARGNAFPYPATLEIR